MLIRQSILWSWGSSAPKLIAVQFVQLPVLTHHLDRRVDLNLIMALVWCRKALPGVLSALILVDELLLPPSEIRGVLVLEPANS